MATGCRCQCHHWCWGNNRALHQQGKLMTAFDWAQRQRVWDYHMPDGVDVGDVLEAVLACKVCIDQHCGVLSGRPYPIAPRIVKRFVREQADGWTDPPQGEDAT
jgi:hypothetical protein